MENKLLLIKEYHLLLYAGNGNTSHVPHLCSEELQHQLALKNGPWMISKAKL